MIVHKQSVIIPLFGLMMRNSVFENCLQNIRHSYIAITMIIGNNQCKIGICFVFVESSY